MFVGESGIERVVMRTCELMKEDPNGDVRARGGIDLDTIQKVINFWYTYSLDLFGGEISSNAAEYFAAGIKGRYREAEAYEEHGALNQVKNVPVVEAGKLIDKEVPLRNAMNEVLREDYITDCQRGLKRWNKVLRESGLEQRLTLPSRRFHRHQGEYAGHHFDREGQLISAEEFAARRDEWFVSEKDLAYLRSIMTPVYTPGKFANWIAPPRKGINNQPDDFEYVRI